MIDKNKKILNGIRVFFKQPDKQKHFIVGLAICALITIACLLQEVPLGMTPAGALLIPLIGAFVVFVLSIIWEFIGSTGFDWLDILAAIAGCVVVWVFCAYGSLLWHLNVV